MKTFLEIPGHCPLESSTFTEIVSDVGPSHRQTILYANFARPQSTRKLTKKFHEQNFAETLKFEESKGCASRVRREIKSPFGKDKRRVFLSQRLFSYNSLYLFFN